MATDQKIEIDLGLTRLEYNDPARPRKAVLTICTSKHYNGGLESDATVYWVGAHSRQHAFGLAGGGDFKKTLLRSDRSVKATQRNIDKQHAEIFTPEVVESLTQTAKEYYKQ